MNKIHLQSTFMTPEILFDLENKRFCIKGRSLPEDAKSFYRPYIDWLNSAFKNNHIEIDFVFELIYFNSASTKMLLDILFILRNASMNEHKINVIWRCEDDDEEMINVGHELEEIVNLPFKIECIEPISHS